MDPTLFALQKLPIKTPKTYTSENISINPKGIVTEFIQPQSIQIPFHGYFNNDSAIILANMDSIYHLTDQRGALLSPQTSGAFTYFDLSGEFSGFSEYCRYRRPFSYGYGLPRKSYDPGQPRFEMIEGIQDLYQQNIDLITHRFWSINSGGVDFSFSHQSTDPLLEAYFAIHFLKPLASTLVKIQSKSIVYLMSQCFIESVIIKSVVDGEYYYIGRFRNEYPTTEIERLIKEGYNDAEIKYSKRFDKWYEDSMKTSEYPELKSEDLYRCLIYWNIPVFGIKNSLIQMN